MMTIGKVALQAGMTTDAVRYYEQEGLIQPAAKSGGGYRLYDVDAVRRLGFIRHAQKCGFTLAEIRELLTLRGSAFHPHLFVLQFHLQFRNLGSQIHYLVGHGFIRWRRCGVFIRHRLRKSDCGSC